MAYVHLSALGFRSTLCLYHCVKSLYLHRLPACLHLVLTPVQSHQSWTAVRPSVPTLHQHHTRPIANVWNRARPPLSMYKQTHPHADNFISWTSHSLSELLFVSMRSTQQAAENIPQGFWSISAAFQTVDSSNLFLTANKQGALCCSTLNLGMTCQVFG